MTKLLIIEDDPLMSRLYQRIFTFEKYQVELAGDGEEGLAKVRASRPTLILCDVMMPKMNGLQVLDNLKADPATKDIPIVMLTNLASQQDAEVALSKGALKYIIKSEHDPRDVLEMIKGILATSAPAETPAVKPATIVSIPGTPAAQAII